MTSPVGHERLHRRLGHQLCHAPSLFELHPGIVTTILATPSDASAADSDAWASHLFDRMLDQSLSIEEFEDAVASHWRQARFMRRAPQTAARLRAAALGVGSDAGYASDAPELGFRSQWHCTPRPQWVFILVGEMEIGLQDGSTRLFRPGEHFFSADTLPEGASFDARVHGHWSAQRGPHALETLFLKP